MKTKLVLLLVLCGMVTFSAAQDSVATPSLQLSAYIEAYYSNDLSNPSDHLRPNFFYSYNRHHEVALNLGYLKAAYHAERVRGNLALMTGTYAQYNLAAEPDILQHIYEANAGIKLAKKQDLWLDLGVLPAHIGFESAVGKDCWTLTRSLAAENSPYYETGARLSYTSTNQQLYLALLLVNGWQRMVRLEGNQSLNFGTQLSYKPDHKFSFNWSTYMGEEGSGPRTLTRIFNNFYGIFNLSDQWGLVTGLDIGIQENLDGPASTWIAPIAILRHTINDHWALAGRVEFYGDPDQVIIASEVGGFKTWGLSLNLDYLPMPNVALRVEGRTLNGQGNYFLNRDGQRSYSNTFLTTALAISF